MVKPLVMMTFVLQDAIDAVLSFHYAQKKFIAALCHQAHVQVHILCMCIIFTHLHLYDSIACVLINGKMILTKQTLCFFHVHYIMHMLSISLQDRLKDVSNVHNVLYTSGLG